MYNKIKHNIPPFRPPTWLKTKTKKVENPRNNQTFIAISARIRRMQSHKKLATTKINNKKMQKKKINREKNPDKKKTISI